MDRRVAHVADPSTDRSLPSLLVRPDGVIGWAATGGIDASRAPEGEPDAPREREQLEAVMGQWGGAALDGAA